MLIITIKEGTIFGRITLSTYFCTYINTLMMIAANYTEFRTALKDYLDRVENDKETLIVKRKKGSGAVIISLDEYNSIMETMHLLSSRKNAQRLFESIDQMKSGSTVQNDLIEE